MHPELHRFVARFVGTVVLTLASVVFAAFVTLPMSLGHHPGDSLEAREQAADAT